MLLVPGVLFGPHLVADDGTQSGFADQRVLVGAVKEGFVRYWRAGKGDHASGMGGVVEYWFRFHVAKGLIALALVAVSAALAVVVWRAFLRSAGARRGGLAVAGVGVTGVGLLSLGVAAANAQGAVAPFTSALTMVPVGTRDGALGQTLDEVRAELATDPHRASPALAEMIGDNARYHVSMAVIAGVVAAGSAVVSVVLWRRFARAGDRRTRRLLGAFGGLGTVLAVAWLVVGAANVTVAADSARGLAGFFGT